MTKNQAIALLSNKTWRLNHLYKIVTKEGVKRIFTPNVAQRTLINNPSKRRLILKARQMGMSTWGLIDMFDDVITNQNFTAAIIAHEQDAVARLFRIISRAYNFLDDRAKPQLYRGGGSKYELFFPSLNSRIYTDLAIRGDTVQRLHISEAHFIKDEDALRATIESVPMDRQITIESTPNGMGGLFYEYWIDPDIGYQKVFFPWFIFPEYQVQTDALQLTSEESEFVNNVKKRYSIDITYGQIAFRRLKQRSLKNLFPQEYPEDDQNCFLSSGNPVMDLVLIKSLIDMCPKPLYADGIVTIFKSFNKTHQYVCGVDTAEGIGQDWSVASMFDCATKEQAAVLAVHKTKPYDFAHLLKHFCARFTSSVSAPLLGIEKNNHGHAVLLELEENIQYPNLYYRKVAGNKDKRPGWLTDRVSRPLMIDTFVEGVEHRTISLYDRITLTECLTLINNEGKIEASEGKHDDRIIAAAIAVQLMLEYGMNSLYENISEKILT